MSTEKKVEIRSACPKPCSSCPWRFANQDSKPDPHGFYTSANRRRLWAGLRQGVQMTCHPTDPRMAGFAGYESLADRNVTHECAGALTLQQRELMKFQDISAADPKGPTLKTYKKQHPKGMTRDGLVSLVERSVFGGTSIGGVAMASPDLNDVEIGYDVLGAWAVKPT